jgi:hypothetical protein
MRQKPGERASFPRTASCAAAAAAAAAATTGVGGRLRSPGNKPQTLLCSHALRPVVSCMYVSMCTLHTCVRPGNTLLDWKCPGQTGRTRRVSGCVVEWLQQASSRLPMKKKREHPFRSMMTACPCSRSPYGRPDFTAAGEGFHLDLTSSTTLDDRRRRPRKPHPRLWVPVVLGLLFGEQVAPLPDRSKLGELHSALSCIVRCVGEAAEVCLVSGRALSSGPVWRVVGGTDELSMSLID